MLAAGIVKANAGSVSSTNSTRASSRCTASASSRSSRTIHYRSTCRASKRYIRYRAALWGIDPTGAWARAKLLLERLEGVHEAFAYPLAGALIAAPETAGARPSAAGVRRADSRRGRTAGDFFDAHVGCRRAKIPNARADRALGRGADVTAAILARDRCDAIARRTPHDRLRFCSSRRGCVRPAQRTGGAALLLRVCLASSSR